MRKNIHATVLCLRLFISIILTVISGAFFISALELGYIIKSKNAIKVIENAVICVLTLISAVLTALTVYKKNFLTRIFFLALCFLSVLSVGLFLIIDLGFIDKIDSVNDVRAYISSFGGYSFLLYVVLQFLQVAVFPIPSVITIGAGVLLFGPLKAAILSVVGIISGSLFAFFIGRKLGVKAVKWLIGANNLEKGLKFVEGKNEILLIIMFLFPFFPDDVLCFAAGLTKVKASFFTGMIFIVRTITVFTSCFSINNSLIPYNTWWGALIYICFFIFAVFAAIFILRKSDGIKAKIKKFGKSTK